MEIKKLIASDTNQFCALIKNMYNNLTSLEWFPPMPFDEENVKSMIESDRLYIIGVFDGKTLCAVSSFDYKCGKLIGKIDFPKECNTDKLVEIGFNIVSTEYRGHGIMKMMIDYLLKEAKNQGFEWIFGKVHKDNFASSKSFLKNDFYKFTSYKKPIKIKDINSILKDNILSNEAAESIKLRLTETKSEEEIIYTDYDIFIKKL